eukprot:scaffold40359_cov69-Phaeocystis_antarctica.AAC.2
MRSRSLSARAVASSAFRSSVNAAEALPRAHRQGKGGSRVVARLALAPVDEAGSITRHAAVPTLGHPSWQPRLGSVEPEPQAIRRSELCRHEAVCPRAPRTGPRSGRASGALGGHEEAGGARVRWGPAGRAGGCGSWEEEDSCGHQHERTDAHIVRLVPGTWYHVQVTPTRTFLCREGGVIKRKLRRDSPVGALPVRELSAEQLAAVPRLCAVALLGCGEVDRNSGLPPVRA